MRLILSLAATLLAGAVAQAQTYPSGTGTDVSPWYFIKDFTEQGFLGINPATRVAYLNYGEDGFTDNVTYPYPFFPYGNTSMSLRAHNDNCSYAYFQNVSSATTPTAYRIVFTNTDPSGLGPVIFSLTCPGYGNQQTGCFVGFKITSLKTGANYLTYDGVDGDHSFQWIVVPDPLPAAVASTVTSQEMIWGTETVAPTLQTVRTSVCALTTSARPGGTTTAPTAAVYTFTVTEASSTYTTAMNPSQANSYTRALASRSHDSSVSARVSSLSANSVSRASVISTHAAAVSSHDVSLSSARASVASRQSTHSASLALDRASRTSRQSTHSATLALLRTSRSLRQSTHSATLAALRSSRASYNSMHGSTLSINRVSRSQVRASKSSVKSAATLSRSQRSTAIATSKLLASRSRDSLRSVATASKISAASARSSARVVASASKSSASLARVSANLANSASRSSASLARASANAVLSSNAIVRSSSLASASSVRAAASASKESVISASIASVQSVLAAQGGGSATGNASRKLSLLLVLQHS